MLRQSKREGARERDRQTDIRREKGGMLSLMVNVQPTSSYLKAMRMGEAEGVGVGGEKRLWPALMPEG